MTNITYSKISPEFHHTSLARGYVGVHDFPVIESYSGRFGTGYKVLRHNPDSTRYFYVDYYIFSEETAE